MINRLRAVLRANRLFIMMLAPLFCVLAYRYIVLSSTSIDGKPRLSLNANKGSLDSVRLQYTLPKNVKIATNIIQPQMPPRIHRREYPTPMQYTPGFEDYLETPLLKDAMFPSKSEYKRMVDDLVARVKSCGFNVVEVSSKIPLEQSMVPMDCAVINLEFTSIKLKNNISAVATVTLIEPVSDSLGVITPIIGTHHDSIASSRSKGFIQACMIEAMNDFRSKVSRLKEMPRKSRL